MNVTAVREAVDKLNAVRGYLCAEILGGVAADVINAASSQFGIAFCEDYRQFLMELGHIDLKSVQICGVTDFGGSMQYTFHYITECFYRDHLKIELPHTTVLCEEGDYEWVLLLDHRSGTVIPYDGIAKHLVHDSACSLETAILQLLGV